MINLRAERLNRGLSVRELADEVGVDRRVIARLEDGGTAHPANVKRVADYFGCKVTDLISIDVERAA
jgi:transcriptional regulator with XRE-family HTH domain